MKIDTINYAYNGTITIKNNKNEKCINGLHIINIGPDEFNFNLCNDEIVITENSDGDLVSDYWIREYDIENKRLIIFLNVNDLDAFCTKTYYLFWGNEILDGNKFSNTSGLNTVFTYDFKNNLSPDIFYITNGVIVNSDNIYVTSANYIQLNNDINIDTNWCIDVNIRTGFNSNIEGQHSFKLATYGDRNQVYFYIQGTMLYHNFNTGIYEAVEVPILSDKFYNVKLYYNLYEDSVRIVFTDINFNTIVDKKIFRNVYGNTEINNLSLGSNTHSSNIYNFSVYDNSKYDLSVIYYSLYFEHKQINPKKIDYNKYSLDKTDDVYIFTDMKSNSNITNIIDDTYSLANTWISDIDVLNGNIIIDFLCKNNINIQDNNLKCYDSGHIKYYGAGNLIIDYNEDGYDYFIGNSNSGWVSFYFDEPVCLNTIYFKNKTDHENGMIKDFTIEVADKKPIFRPDWINISEGTLLVNEYNQLHRIANIGYHKCYKINILSTHGENICLSSISFHSPSGNATQVIRKLRLYPIKDVFLENTFPKIISLYGSNDFIKWKNIMVDKNTYTPYNKYNNSYWQDYTLINNSNYAIYKLSLNGNWGDEENRIGITEIELLEYKSEDYTYRILKGSNYIRKTIYDSLSKLTYIVNEYINVVDENNKLIGFTKLDTSYMVMDNNFNFTDNKIIDNNFNWFLYNDAFKDVILI